ncbi:amidohydrolase family protein [Rhodococcus hoagii]|nr:amidohydrolase family protein [Prescottella equi]
MRIANGESQVSRRCANNSSAGLADQADGRRWRGVDVRPAVHGAVHRRELRAAVDAATDYGTYVATHVYNVTGIRRAIEAGVKSIEHGHLADEDTVALMASVTCGVDAAVRRGRPPLPDPDAPRRTGDLRRGRTGLRLGAQHTGCGSPSVRSAPRTRVRRAAERDGGNAWPTTSATGGAEDADVGQCPTVPSGGGAGPVPGRPVRSDRPGAWADVLLVEGIRSRTCRCSPTRTQAPRRHRQGAASFTRNTL